MFAKPHGNSMMEDPSGTEETSEDMAYWILARKIFTAASAVGLAIYAFYLIKSWKRKKTR